MNNENNSFEYNYSAKEQKEIKKIRAKYISEETDEDKMEKLRRLDSDVTNMATMISLVIGIVGTLIFGLGLCCILEWDYFIPGLFIGPIGLIGVLQAYPIYRRVTKKMREKIAPEIIRLTDELMK